jgi:hypothetical protein
VKNRKLSRTTTVWGTILATLLLVIAAPYDAYGRSRIRQRPIVGRVWERRISNSSVSPRRRTTPAATRVPTQGAVLQTRIAKLIATLDYVEFPEPNFMGYSQSVDELIEIGRPAMGPLLEVMLQGNRDDLEERLAASRSTVHTPEEDAVGEIRSLRFCAMAALSVIGAREYGFVLGQGYADDDKMWEWQRIRQEIGEPDWDAPYAERLRVVENWRAHFHVR